MKAPAALSRKVAEAVQTGGDEIVVWGTGEQTRSFMYIDDCIKGTQMIMHSDVREPVNLGSSELVSVTGLLDIIEGIAGASLTQQHDLTKPKGVNGRNSDNSRIMDYLGWEPSIPLRDGLARTYEWVYAQVAEARARKEAGESTPSVYALP